MHRIKIDENNPESEYEQYLFDPKADLRDIPKYMETEHFGKGGNRSGNAASKRFLVMTTLERPKTASEMRLSKIQIQTLYQVMLFTISIAIARGYF